jgi:hypothetical protein
MKMLRRTLWGSLRVFFAVFGLGGGPDDLLTSADSDLGHAIDPNG